MKNYKKEIEFDKPKPIDEFYIPCYDGIKKEIYFFEFFTEKIVKEKKQEIEEDQEEDENNNMQLMQMDISIKKNKEEIQKAKRHKELVEDCKHKLAYDFKRIQLLSGFKMNVNYLPKRIQDYFGRPFYSRFFFHENKDLYSFNDCVSLPNVIARYDTTDVRVYCTKESILGDKDRPIDVATDQDVLLNEKVSFLYIIDTLIKDCVKELYAKLNDEESKNKIEDSLKEGYKFVLKRVEYEEYLYGDYTLGAYDFVRTYSRQHNTIRLILKKLPFHKIKPPVFAFPPILGTAHENAHFKHLLEQYLNLYPEFPIIFRVCKPKASQIDRYMKSNKNRVAHLSHFCESGDCDFPFMFKITEIKNIMRLIDWFEDKKYNRNPMFLPYFRDYPIKKEAKTQKKKNNVITKISGITWFMSKEDKEKIENIKKEEKKKNEQEKDEKKEHKEHEHIRKGQKEEFKINTEDEKKLFKFLQTNLEDEHIIDYSKAKKGLNFQKEDNGFMKLLFNQKEKENNKNEKQSKQDQQTRNTLEGSIQEKKFKPFTLSGRVLPTTPIFIRIHISLLYGSYLLYTFKTAPFLLSDNILVNDKVALDPKNGLISHLPFETRIGLSIEAFDGNLEEAKGDPFILGSCQVPLYKDNCEMQTGKIVFELWPKLIIFPRVNCSTPFSPVFFLPNEKETNTDNEEEKMEMIENSNENIQNNIIQDGFGNKIGRDGKKGKEGKARKEIKELNLGEYTNEILEKKEDYNNKFSDIKKKFSQPSVLEQLPPEFNEVQRLFFKKEEYQKKKEELRKKMEEEEKFKKEQKNNKDHNLPKNDETKIIHKTEKQIREEKRERQERKRKAIDDEEKRKKPECSITLEFPNFAAPIIHTLKNSQSYRNYLELKHNKCLKLNEDDFDEIRRICGNSQLNLINNDIKTNKIVEETKDRKQTTKNEQYPADIRDYMKKTLPKLVQVLKKDPLEKLDENDIVTILVCRDYICPIPSALELFLRAINWRNPLETSIAHLYLKKWTKIEGEDAVSLLDARFPDTAVREYAISILRDLTDDIVSLYMLQLSQCLLYETFLINPLSDFLLERSLKNPQLIGNSFFWSSCVGMINPLFTERLSIYRFELLMIGGDCFLNQCHKGVLLNYHLELMTLNAKKIYAAASEPKKKPTIQFIKNVGQYLNAHKIYKKFVLPIDPTYLGVKFNEKAICFNSKMVPVKLVINSREDPFTINVIFKIGDDLRQDVLTLQILKIMDKLWLSKNLDLKVLPYKVIPTGLKSGFIECVDGEEMAQIQQKSGGALDREVIIKYLRDPTNPLPGTTTDPDKKDGNFISSLAGYCVATCVIGVADRHSSNVMIKKNGIFFHIDFGHILGKFKYKFGFKRERSVFLLTPEMANVYTNANKEELFKQNCVDAFNILRHNAQRLMNLFIIMGTAGMPEVRGMNDIKYLKDMLKLDLKNDEDAGNYFIGAIRACKNEKFRLIDNMIHNIKVG